MEEKPVVSVLMGSHNPRWDLLRRSVLSLAGQTCKSWELILWDDGSSPAGAMVLEQAAAWDPGCGCTGDGKTGAWGTP